MLSPLQSTLWHSALNSAMFVLTCVPPNNPISACGATLSPGYHSFPKWAIGSILINEFSETLFFGTSSKNAYGWNTGRTRTEPIEKGYGTGTERIPNGYRTGMGTHVEQQQNAFCQAFPVRFLLTGTVGSSSLLRKIVAWLGRFVCMLI